MKYTWKQKITMGAAILGAVALAVLVGFLIGWSIAPNHVGKGYKYGNQDGYSIGYIDGRIGASPNMHRHMNDDDYAFRFDIGGREIGQ